MGSREAAQFYTIVGDAFVPASGSILHQSITKLTVNKKAISCMWRHVPKLSYANSSRTFIIEAGGAMKEEHHLNHKENAMFYLLTEMEISLLVIGFFPIIAHWAYLFCKRVLLLRQSFWQGSKLKWESKNLEIQYRQKKKKSAERKRTRKRK